MIDIRFTPVSVALVGVASSHDAIMTDAAPTGEDLSSEAELLLDLPILEIHPDHPADLDRFVLAVAQ
ncbi:MAG: hypothetical protein MZV70_29695, partial [Desulfobacterales bacterium]|nr:hypothetical protein [Desulfobacterales bacterium]